MIQRIIYKEEYSNCKTYQQVWNGNINRKILDSGFLGQDPAGCKSCWITNVYSKLGILNILIVKFLVKIEKDVQHKLAKFAQIMGILNKTFETNFSRNVQEQQYIMH
jgi:hypothetical protein